MLNYTTLGFALQEASSTFKTNFYNYNVGGMAIAAPSFFALSTYRERGHDNEFI